MMSLRKMCQPILTTSRYIYAESANTKNLKKVLSYYPIIVKYSYQKESMKRSNPDYVNYEIAKQHYSDLLNNWDFFVYDYKKAFNPLVALKATFSIPSSFLNWIGFYPRRINLNFFNLTFWFINLYSNEIKSFINLLIQKLIYT